MPLKGVQVLIVEDEPLLALDLEAALRAAQALPTAASSFDQAFHHLETAQVDACVADLELWGQDAAPLIDTLKRKGIPFMTYSGYADPPTRSTFAHVQKPKTADAVVEALRQLFDRGS